jgi:ribosomal protein L11 methyltransferase
MTKALWQISVRVTPMTEEAVAECLADVFGQPASIFTNLEKGTTTASVHLEKLPGTMSKVLASLEVRLKALNVGISSRAIAFRKLPPENWAESWKRHFKPLEIGNALLIRPSWSQRKARAGQALVTLDPGLSFGTGQHATTFFCLRRLAAHRKTGEKQSLLDIGCGSGILAISAAKLGYKPVDAFDFDPQAVRSSRQNARANETRLTIRLDDLTRQPLTVPRQYDVVCANLIFDLLISEAEKICNRVKPDGILVLAGILKTQFEAVRAAFAAQGMRFKTGKCEKEWRSGEFRRA